MKQVAEVITPPLTLRAEKVKRRSLLSKIREGNGRAERLIEQDNQEVQI